MARLDPLRFIPEDALPVISVLARVPCIGFGLFGIYGAWRFGTLGWFGSASIFLLAAGFIPASRPGSSNRRSVWLSVISAFALILWLAHMAKMNWLRNADQDDDWLFVSFWVVASLIFLALLGARPVEDAERRTQEDPAGPPESRSE